MSIFKKIWGSKKLKGAEETALKTSTILIPKEDQQTVTVLESFTVMWQYRANGYDRWCTSFKVFVNKVEAQEFEKQLTECAKFIGCDIYTKVYTN